MGVRERTISELIRPTIEDLGCELWGVELHTGGKHTKLCIYIDQAEGVTVDDCERVSRALSDLFDVEDIMPDRYTLEVSSPGMDRILFQPEHYAAAVGETIEVRLSVPIEKRKRLTGVLVGVEDAQAVVREGEAEFLLPFETIARARVVPQHSFGNAERPGGKRKRS
ncbi:MAG: ribosome maturation factor RimP [Pseudomonadota bacterium]